MQEYEYEYAEFIYYTPGELDREGQLWPVRAGRSFAKPNYKVGPKRIECYSLHFVLEGKVCFEFEDQQVELQKNDLFCLFPGQTYHYYLLSSELPLRMSWLVLDGGRIMSLLKLAGITPERPFAHGKMRPPLKDALDRMLGAMARFERWNPAVSLELQGLACELLAGLMPESPVVHTSEPSGWIRECMEFMELHATEGISVQQVAAFAGVHRSYFSHAFTNQVGIPPQKYIQNIRMEKARRLLVETEASVTEIALSLGYPNLYTFTRAFKSFYKIPPLYVRAESSG
nr:AraC family transcriptional regulator [Fontibacillus phaseoli]